MSKTTKNTKTEQSMWNQISACAIHFYAGV